MVKNKRKISIFIMLIILLIAGDIYAEAIDFDVSIYIDNNKIDLKRQAKIINARTIIPLREFMDHLHYHVEYDANTKMVLATNGDIKINVNTDKKIVEINDTIKYTDKDMNLYNDSVYLSLRPLVESLSATISWVGEENKIMIGLAEIQDSKLYAKMENIETGQVLEIGMDYDELIRILGNPNRLDEGKLKSKWLIYHYDYTDYNNYIKLKLKDGQLIEMETIGSNWKIIDGIGVGTSLETSQLIVERYDANDIKLELAENAGEISFINIEEKTYDLSLDTDLKNIILDPYEEPVLESMEKQIFDYLNIYRLKNNKSILNYNKDLNQIAREHSKDMGDNDYYGYLNSKGKTFEERLTEIADNNNFVSGAENILAGINMPKDVVNMWMNSEIYSQQILEEFHYVGIGVYFKLESRYGLYFTVDFGGIELDE